MSKASKEAFMDDLVESGNWSQGDLFSRVNIHKWIAEFNEMSRLARTGAIELVDELITNSQIKDMARIKALERMHECLNTIWSNTRFAIKKDKNKRRMDNLNEMLEKIEPWLSETSFTTTTTTIRGETSQLKIDEILFKKIYNILIRLYREMLVPLNESDLIFYSVEEYSVDDIKAQLRDRIVNQG